MILVGTGGQSLWLVPHLWDILMISVGFDNQKCCIMLLCLCDFLAFFTYTMHMHGSVM